MADLLKGSNAMRGIMASDHVNRTNGRTHGCTDQPASVKKSLANSEPALMLPAKWRSAVS
jgi:hypothetical protein